ncbi:rhodanese-related sulfurtransferase [bacterium]|nr:rhodanese-related sulfurtransferase [bacterium]
MPKYTVLIFYMYATIDEPKKLADHLRAVAEKLSIKGRILVAHEGINGTVEGTAGDGATTGGTAEAFARELLASHPALVNMRIKTSAGDGQTFPKLMVKVRNEIVGTRIPGDVADPRRQTAKHLSVDELKKWYEEGKVIGVNASDGEVVIVDMRNDYEYASGHFRGAIDPGMRASRDLPAVLDKLEKFKNKKVLTVCTAGVRCEKMSAYLMSRGFADVYQLEDGMHGYMQKYPGQDFLGTLYTFDNRVTMDFGGAREIIGKCRLCGASSERYLNCANSICHLHFLACEVCAPKGTETATYCSEECRRVNAGMGAKV